MDYICKDDNDLIAIKTNTSSHQNNNTHFRKETSLSDMSLFSSYSKINLEIKAKPVMRNTINRKESLLNDRFVFKNNLDRTFMFKSSGKQIFCKVCKIHNQMTIKDILIIFSFLESSLTVLSFAYLKTNVVNIPIPTRDNIDKAEIAKPKIFNKTIVITSDASVILFNKNIIIFLWIIIFFLYIIIRFLYLQMFFQREYRLFIFAGYPWKTRFRFRTENC